MTKKNPPQHQPWKGAAQRRIKEIEQEALRREVAKMANPPPGMSVHVSSIDRDLVDKFVKAGKATLQPVFETDGVTIKAYAVHVNAEKLDYYELMEHYMRSGQPKDLENLLAYKQDEHHQSFLEPGPVVERVYGFQDNKLRAVQFHCRAATPTPYEKAIIDSVSAEIGETVPAFIHCTQPRRK
jgi:hypothetical protein